MKIIIERNEETGNCNVNFSDDPCDLIAVLGMLEWTAIHVKFYFADRFSSAQAKENAE